MAVERLSHPVVRLVNRILDIQAGLVFILYIKLLHFFRIFINPGLGFSIDHIFNGLFILGNIIFFIAALKVKASAQ